ncbi:MAG: haloacid dehalogenase type II [Rhodospirillaceae bacterium]|jgi:2-haloacid dehalogenase|nr:haloacid dehalogenase type II [Rhodospirillaceae bacterium]|tara:strand:+ start:34 stop:717 length:684 start_codon:yes stop_codon:yes gene_type:complete
MAAKIEDIGACVFDAYGTLFDVAAAAARCRDALGDKADELSAIWRTRQLEYTWLRSLMQEYVEFRQVTGDGLDYALAALGIEDDALRQRLMDIYMRLDAYPEVKDVLTALKSGAIKTAILSNGSPEMLSSAVDNAEIGDLLDDVFSVDSIGVYKPHPSVYQMAVDGLGVDAGRICFMSSNAWDAAAGANFGYRVVWVNRFGQPQERIPGNPEHEVKTLEALPPLLGL